MTDITTNRIYNVYTYTNISLSMYWRKFPRWAFFKMKWVTEMALVVGRVCYAPDIRHFNLLADVQRTVHDLPSFTSIAVSFVMEARVLVAAPAHLLA